MNRIQLIGNLGQDPELRYSQNGTAIATFSIAVNGKDEVDWFRCSCFGKTAEFVSENLRKGDKVYLEGRMKSWKNNDGITFWNVNAWKVVSFNIRRDAIETSESPAPASEPIDDDIPF